MTLCEICESREATKVCKICGRHVCSQHINSNGICSVCQETLCERCGKYLSIGYCKICGRYLCEDCLIQISPVEYVCKDCFNNMWNDNIFKKLS